jgi:hypothetical protein
MGNTPMQCSKCGNNNVNEILVTFLRLANNEEVLDTTTLPKFLYYLEHPNDNFDNRGIRLNTIKKVIGYACDKCHTIDTQKPEICGLQIKSTRYGI